MGGTPIALPSNHVLPTGITVDGTNTVFTVAPAGRYRISYILNTTLGVAIGTGVLVNGSLVPASNIPIGISLSSFSNEILIDLAANSTVSLYAFGASIGLTLLSGAGASLMIMRIT